MTRRNISFFLSFFQLFHRQHCERAELVISQVRQVFTFSFLPHRIVKDPNRLFHSYNKSEISIRVFHLVCQFA